jgi:radical SAM protein with 4Fe4S-binding SPASM domain
MKFLKTYIEISNICNLQCTFCPEVEREKKILSPDNFEQILRDVLPYTEIITLHLMGEPLSHPEFLTILKICESHSAKVHLTTNGTLLPKYHFDEILKNQCLKQINFSLHSFKDNFPKESIKSYLFDILLFSKVALSERPDLYINYRLWNLENSESTSISNTEVIDIVSEFFQIQINDKIHLGFRKSKNITGRIYFHFDSRFDWPSLKNEEVSTKGFCHALSQQIGIHADGTIVPCCLDKEANIELGNVLQQNFEEILKSSRLLRIKQGFQKQVLVEELCQKCTYIKRFQKK